MKEKIKEIMMKLGADVCGVANIDRFENTPAGFHPKDIYKDCKSVVVFAKRIPNGLSFVNSRIVYIKANDICLAEVEQIGYKASIEIENLGGIAVPLPPDAPYEYWDKDKMEGKGLISMRHSAMLAGIGSMGKNSLIINQEYGTMINLGAILTNLDLESDSLSKELCILGCHLCIDSCPQKAIDGKTVNQKLCREFTYSHNDRGFSVCNCNTCRVICPMAFGEKKS